REEVTAIRTSVQLEARLIDDLLDLTRITRGKIELHLEALDIHNLLRNSLEIARDKILEKQLDLVVNFGADRHHVWADAVRLQQVFWNLLNNAVKFTKKSGRITMRTVNEDGRFVFQIPTLEWVLHQSNTLEFSTRSNRANARSAGDLVDSAWG